MAIEPTPDPARQKVSCFFLRIWIGLFVVYLLVFAIFGYGPGDWRMMVLVLALASLAKSQLDPPRRRTWLALAFLGIGLAAIGRIMNA